MINKENKNYPGGKPLVRYVSDAQQYFLPDNTMRSAIIKNGKYTRVEKVVDKGGYKQSLKNPQATVVPGIHQGPYQEFKNNEISLDGWCKVDFNNCVEYVYADRKATRLIKHTKLDKDDFSTRVETRYNMDGSVKSVNPHRNNLPHGDATMFDREDEFGISHMRKIDEFDYGLMKKTVHFSAAHEVEATLHYKDPSLRNYIKVLNKGENKIITQYEDNIAVAKDQRDKFGRCTQSMEYDAKGVLTKGLIADYADNSDLAQSVQEYVVTTHNEQGTPTEAQCVRFDGNYKEIARYPIAIQANRPVPEARRTQQLIQKS